MISRDLTERLKYKKVVFVQLLSIQKWVEYFELWDEFESQYILGKIGYSSKYWSLNDT